MKQTIRHWYEESFGDDYLLIYRHRGRKEAEREVYAMANWLKLAPQSHILDLCCGSGRHALTLADAGYRVTGVDLSAMLLAEARKSDPEGRITWIQGDMRVLPDDAGFRAQFDAVVNLFTSFGYFEQDSEQFKVLQQIRKALKPGGRFVIDLLNAKYTEEHLVRYSERQERGIVIEETRRIENGFVKKQVLVREGDQAPRCYNEQVKLYPFEMLSALLKEAGLAVDNIYGDYDGQVYDSQMSRRMIVVGHRKR